MKEYQLSGVRAQEINVIPDERGFFGEIMRADWKDFFGEDTITQANLSYSYPGIVRAWHRHEHGQVDYFLVLKGAMEICAYDDSTKALNAIVSTGERLQVVRVPGHYWHGFRVLGNKPALLVYFLNRLYDYEKPDELRRPWNDPSIVPKKVNGKENDSRVGRPWDWFFPPHR